MRVKELIARLQKEHSEEEVMFSGVENEPYTIKEGHFLHAGPQQFIDKNGKKYVASVVVIPIVISE